ncbi:MAG: GldG family protein [Myxococcales bacterium]|nr:GldG family protein [Myxococcales bacterium]
MTGTAALLAALGAVAIGFGLLSALLALLQPFTDPLWIAGNLVVGVALLGTAVFMSLDTLRARMRSGSGRRAGKYGTSAVASALLGVLILSLLGFLSTRYSHRFDVSEAGVHTLSQQTTELLAGLDRDVSITAFFSESEAPPIQALLDRYAFASDRVTLRFVDPNAEPALVEELGLTSEDLARGVVRFALESGESTTLSEFSEPDVTNALRKLLKSTGKKVYFLTGHNERETVAGPGDEGDWANGPDTWGRAAGALVNETYAVEPLLLAARGEVPEDASALIVAGPTRPLLASELEAIERYVARGGSLFVAIDPRAQTNLYDLLDAWGIRLGDDVIVDRALALFGQATTPMAAEYDAEHPITTLLREPAIFPMVRSVELDPAAEADFTILAKTGNESWAERDLEASRTTGRIEFGPEDLPGPVPIAVAGSPHRASDAGHPDPHGASAGEAAPGRIVVFGDSDFATNEYLDALRNRDLFVNSINWLAGDVEQIAIRPNVSRASTFQMTQEQFRLIQYLSLFVLPEAIAVLGVFTWWSRRQGSVGRAAGAGGGR